MASRRGGGPSDMLSRRNEAADNGYPIAAQTRRRDTEPMPKIVPLSLLLIAVSQIAPASASSSGWYDAEGGSIRLLTSGAPDRDGIVQGALEIDLKPGWKTYWRDPGDAGVPPSLDVSTSSNVAAADVSFPAPRRFDDGFATWAGYDEPVTLPVAFALADRNAPAKVEAKIFLGICQAICVPLQATLVLETASDPDNADDAAVVQAAVDALPAPARPDFGVTVVEGGKDEILVEAAHPGDPADVDFFLAGAEGYQFGPPDKRVDGGKVLFSVPIIVRPERQPAAGGLPYTLVTAAGAVSGTLPYPPAK